MEFRLVGTSSGFYVNLENERFTAAGSRCCRNLKTKFLLVIWQTTSKKLHQKACRTCSTNILVLNQSYHWFVALALPLAFLKFLKAWFPYRCICRVCRTKKIHRTDRIHSISYNKLYKLYLSFLLYRAVVREVSIKLYLSYEFFFVRQIRKVQRYGNQA